MKLMENKARISSMVIRKGWSLFAIAAMGLGGCGGGAPPPVDPNAPQVQMVATPEFGRRIDGPPSQLFELIKQSREQMAQFGDAARSGSAMSAVSQRYLAAVVQAIAAADGIIENPKASDGQKLKANRAKLEVLFEASNVDRAECGRRFNILVEQILADNPKNDLPAMAAALKIAETHFATNSSDDKVLAALEDYGEKYPDSPFGFDLFEAHIKRLSAKQNDVEVLKVKMIANKSYPPVRKIEKGSVEKKNEAAPATLETKANPNAAAAQDTKDKPGTKADEDSKVSPDTKDNPESKAAPDAKPGADAKAVPKSGEQ